MNKRDRRRSRRAVRKNLLKARILMAAAILICIICCMGCCSRFLNSHDSEQNYNLSSDSLHYKSILIRPGDSLWSIAEEYKPDSCESVESYMAELKELNSLSSDTIHAYHYLMIAYSK